MMMDFIIRVLSTSSETISELTSSSESSENSESSSPSSKKNVKEISNSYLNVELDLENFIDPDLDTVQNPNMVQDVDVKKLLKNIRKHNKLNERVIKTIYTKCYEKTNTDSELIKYITQLVLECRRNSNTTIRRIGKNMFPFSKVVVEWLLPDDPRLNQKGSADVKSATVDEISISV